MERQLRTMPHVMFGGLTHEPARLLADRLGALLPGAGTDAALQHVFFCDSGSVAVEIALKMAVQYWRNQGQPGRTRFIAFRRAYHGDTMGAMAVGDPDDGMHALFNGYFPKQILTDLPRTPEQRTAFSALLAERRNEIAGVILEPLVQGAGGMVFHDAETLAAIRHACTAQDILFIADEIATGFGRTGTMFACDAADIAPDIIWSPAAPCRVSATSGRWAPSAWFRWNARARLAGCGGVLSRKGCGYGRLATWCI